MGAAVGGSRSRRGGIVGINVTPMVDVMLVLLVIMMVSATYIVSRALKVELPKSASSDESTQGPITVTITQQGQYFVKDEQVPNDAALIGIFQKAKAMPGEPAIVVSADGSAQHRWVVHVIDLAKQQGIFKFAINVQAGE
ncbi:MAG: ExbD/TolR family protein [Polyangiaceae bacterium]